MALEEAGTLGGRRLVEGVRAVRMWSSTGRAGAVGLKRRAVVVDGGAGGWGRRRRGRRGPSGASKQSLRWRMSRRTALDGEGRVVAVVDGDFDEGAVLPVGAYGGGDSEGFVVDGVALLG